MKVLNLEDIRRGIRVSKISVALVQLLLWGHKELENLCISSLFHCIGGSFKSGDPSFINESSFIFKFIGFFFFSLIFLNLLFIIFNF